MATESLPNGTTKRIHADWTMTQIEQSLTPAFARMRSGAKVLRRDERDALSRSLAGAIGRLEDLRRWIERGTPE